MKQHQVIYWKLNDESNTQRLTENILSLIEENNFHKFEYQTPDEYRLDHQLDEFCSKLNIENKVPKNAATRAKIKPVQ